MARAGAAAAMVVLTEITQSRNRDRFEAETLLGCPSSGGGRARRPGHLHLPAPLGRPVVR
jgi:hypothetical protein